MTTTTVRIYSKDGPSGSSLYDFDPVPSSVTWNLDNSPGKMGMDMPGYHRPWLFYSSSSNRTLTIKAVLLGTDYTSATIANALDDLIYIMSGAHSDYYHILIPLDENMSGSPHTYSTTDSAIDNAIFADGQNYMKIVAHPDSMQVERTNYNLVYVTLTFSEVSDVTSLG